MTATAQTRPPQEDWHEQLARVIGPWAFPARRDDLVALLIRHHAPSHLVWHLSGLPPTREFASVADLLEVAAKGGPPGHLVAEPM